MNTRSLFLIFVVIGFVCSSASATVYNDWFDNSTLNTTIWNWTPEPDGSYDIDTSAPGYMVVTTSAEANLLQIGDYNNYPNSTLETEINAYVMASGSNYEHIRLVLNDSSGNKLFMRVQRDYANRVIRTYDGATRVATYTAAQADTYNLKLKIVKRTDGSTVNISTYYKLDTGDWVQQANNRTITNDYNSCGLSFTGGSYFYVNYFTFTDDDTGISIPVEPSTTIDYDITVSETYNYINIDDTRVDNLIQVYTWLNNWYDPGNADVYLTEATEGNWESKYAIFCLDGDNGKHFTIEADTFKVDNTIGSSYFPRKALIGNITIAPGTTVIGYDFDTDTLQNYTSSGDATDTTGSVWLSQPCSDVVLSNFRTVIFGDDKESSWPNPDFIEVTGQAYDNVTIYNTSTISYFEGANNTYTNFTFESGEASHMGAFASMSFDNCLLDGLYVNCTGSEGSLGYGLWLYPENSTIRNVLIDNAIYSGININGLAVADGVAAKDVATIMDNITVKNSQHNGFEIQASNVTITNSSVESSKYHNYFTAGKQEDGNWLDNIVFDGMYSNDAGSHAIVVGEGTFNSAFKNFEIVGSGIYIFNSENNKFINVTHVNNLDNSDSANEQSGIYITKVTGQNFSSTNNNTFININTTNNNYKAIYHVYGDDEIYANVNTEDGIAFTDGDYTQMYPLNVRVLNSTGYPVQDAELTLTATTFGLDGLGNYFVNTTTDENGYPVSPIYVPDYRRDSATGYTYYNLNTVSAEKDGESVTSAAFNPDETWYSIDSSSPNGTLITLTLDVTGLANDTYTIETQSESFVNPTFVAVGGGFAAGIFVISSWFNQRRKRW